MGSRNGFDLAALYGEPKSLNEGRLMAPGYSMDGRYGRLFQGIGLHLDKPTGRVTKKDMHHLSHKEPTRINVEGINLTYEGVIPKVQKSMLSKDVDALQPHVRRFVERVVTFTTCTECGGTRLTREALASKISGKNIADLCAMQISDLADWIRELDEPGGTARGDHGGSPPRGAVAPLLAGLQHL